MNTWNPRDIRNLIAQITGIVFAIGGIILMIIGVQSTGKINISTKILSGEIESGSAGLLLLFFAFFLILIPSFIGSFEIKKSKQNRSKPRENMIDKKKTLIYILGSIGIFLISIGMTFGCFIGGQYLRDVQHQEIGGFLVFVGYLSGIWTIILIGAIIAALINTLAENETEKETETSDEKSK
jgi:MFS family permease